MFRNVLDKTLVITVKRLRTALMEIIDMGDKAFEQKKPGAATPSDTFHMKMALLGEMEKEMTKRGLPTTHPSLGPDVLDMIARRMN